MRWSGGPAVGRSIRALVSVAGLLTASPPDRLTAVVQCPDGSPPPCRAPTARTTAIPTPNSVAVLYFDNLSPDTADAYLADGLTEEIIARLGQLERLTVQSRFAVRRYRGVPAADPAAVGRTLKAAHLVTGSVRRSTNRVRVTVELVRAASGVRVWGEQYDRSDADLLQIEEDIARAVATAIAGRLLPAERASLARTPTSNREAYDHFLRGNYYLAQRQSRAAQRAIEEFEAAARLDPRFTAALARLSYAYGLAVDWIWELRGLAPDSLLGLGLAAAERALRQDSTISDGWMAFGTLLTYRHPLSYEGVLQALSQAVALDPRNAEARHEYARRLIELGRDAEAGAELHQALAIEPERPISLIGLAVLSTLTRRYAEGLRWADSALAIDPGFAHGYEHRAHIRSLMGDLTAAQADAATAARLLGRMDADPVQALVAGRAGDTASVRAAWERWRRRVSHPGRVVEERTLWLIGALVAVGERDAALAALGRAPRAARVWRLLQLADFDPLHDDPRFQRLVEESRPR